MPKAPTDPPRRRTSPPRPQATLAFTWNRPARQALLALAQSATASGTPTLPEPALLNRIIRRAVKRTLATVPPLYPELILRLSEQAEPHFRMDISWVDDAAMQELNRDYRGKNKPTDVLSFPLFEGEVFDMDEEALALGDMVLSVETAVRQANELKHPLTREVAFLAIHGTLHLLGYDHVTAPGRKRMFALQDDILASMEAAHEI